MHLVRPLLGVLAFVFATALGAGTFLLLQQADAAVVQDSSGGRVTRKPSPSFELDVLVNGRPLEEHYARGGRTYIEAIRGAEYELRLRNGTPDRVAVALSVDGLNTIDARHTSAWNASNWVIEPYQTITISGWQMSTQRARRFYFTNERDSYGAKLGQTANLGVISAVFFREQRRRPIAPITRAEEAPTSAPKAGAADSMMRRDDENAATGIGRNVRNDVQWVEMELDSRAASELTIRYEFGQRRETTRGFSPEP
jgi:hypothetical protein